MSMKQPEAEDELLLLQKQALAEEEAAKTKAEILSRFLKDKLVREKQSSTLNLHKLTAQWRAVLRVAKAKDLRQDIEILSRTFARVMDSKDSVIESLAADLEEAEEQRFRALGSHLQNFDRLLQLQRCRLRCLQEGYEAQVEAMKMEFEAERRIILEQQEQESCYLQEVTLATERKRSKNTHEVTQNFQSAQADIINKSLCEKQYSRTQMSKKMEVLWEQFRQVMRNYAEATEHQKITYDVLKEKDQKSSREIKMQAKKLQRLQDLVAATKSQMVAHRWESKEQLRRAQEEKERSFRQLLELEGKLKQARAKARGDLLRLTLQSNSALKRLRKVVEKAEGILRLAEMCRRLETDEEKVLPFDCSSLAEQEQQDAQRVLEEAPAEPLAQALQDYVGLEGFWQRFNKVKLEVQALEKEQLALKERNQQLRKLLGQYLAGISVSEEVLVEPNPLLSIHPKSCISRSLPHASGKRARGRRDDAQPLGRKEKL